MARFVLFHSAGPSWAAGVPYVSQPGVVEAPDLLAAEALVAEDASVHGGLLPVEVRDWGPRMGSWLAF